MDTGQGKFEILSALAIGLHDGNAQKAAEEMERSHPKHGGWFREGEIIEIRGSRFRIKSVKPTELRLKLLPRED